MKRLLSAILIALMLVVSAPVSNNCFNSSIIVVDAATSTYVTTTALNMRKSASQSSEKLVVVPKDATVTSDGTKSGEYIKVTYKTGGKSYTGWILSEYVKKKTNTPAKVTGLKASASGSTSIKLTWSKVSSVTGYYVYKYSNGKYTKLATVKTNSYTVKNLKKNTSYSFAVAAYLTKGSKTYIGSKSSVVKQKTIVNTSIKEAYKKVIKKYGYSDTIYYSFFDVNKDGIKELIINDLSHSMVEAKYIFYSYKDGKATNIGTIPSSACDLWYKGSQLYICHDGYGVIFYEKVLMKNGKVVQGSVISEANQGNMDKYIKISDYIHNNFKLLNYSETESYSLLNSTFK